MLTAGLCVLIVSLLTLTWSACFQWNWSSASEMLILVSDLHHTHTHTHLQLKSWTCVSLVLFLQIWRSLCLRILWSESEVFDSLQWFLCICPRDFTLSFSRQAGGGDPRRQRPQWRQGHSVWVNQRRRFIPVSAGSVPIRKASSEQVSFTGMVKATLIHLCSS